MEEEVNDGSVKWTKSSKQYLEATEATYRLFITVCLRIETKYTEEYNEHRLICLHLQGIRTMKDKFNNGFEQEKTTCKIKQRNNVFLHEYCMTTMINFVPG